MKTDNSRAIRARLSMRGGIALVLLCPLVSVVWAELPTGMMIKALPTGPGALELPATTSTSSYRIPSKQAYGLVGHTDPVIAASDRISPTELVDATPVKFAKSQQVIDGPTWCYPFIAVCPVTLRDERKVVRPSPEFTSVHNGQRYKFASAEAQAKFDASPEQYVPAIDGNDTVLASMGAVGYEGSLRHPGIFEGKLYLFHSERTADMFRKDPTQFLAKE